MAFIERRFFFWGSLAALLLIGLFITFRPRAVIVDLITIDRGRLDITVAEESQTRVHDVYVLSAPIAGHMRRLDLHAGDTVTALETVVARIEPIDPAFLDPRSEAQAKANVRAAESSRALALAEVEQAQAEVEFAEREHKRANQLIRNGTISQRDLELAERNIDTSRAALSTTIAALDVRNYELERAQAALVSPIDTVKSMVDCDCISIRSPVNGQILRLLQQSETVVPAGAPLVEIGDSRNLEIVVDLLSADAVKVEAGQRAIIERWGGDRALEGRVRLVEPFGFTKVSALGIEEQRVNVIIDLVSDAAEWTRLAHGYQVDVKIVLWEDDDVLTVPLLALFRDGDRWAVFVESGGRAERRYVEIGRRNSLDAEIVEGLEAGDRVVLYPSDRVVAGVRIAKRV